MIDQTTIDKIYEVAQITEVISDFVSLKRRGANYIGLCPFHNEKTPSFTVSPTKGIYKCFGCGRAGNTVNFIMEHENLSYPEALRYLAKKYHIDIIEKSSSTEEIAQRNERESMLTINAFAARYFHQYLLESDEGKSIAIAYFRNRGIRDDMIIKFQLGFAPENRQTFTKEAQKQGFKLEYLLKTGLTVEREHQLFDRFAGRVIFPIQSLSGQTIGFGGRTLKTDKTVAKYINSPESEIYHKSNSLYGIFQAKKAIVQQDKCYLVEGYTDVIALHQANIENAVASSGTSLTTDQIRIIKRFTNNLTIVYDGDAAGIKAALRGIDMALEEGMNVRVILLPEGEDPDSFCRSNTAQKINQYFSSNETDFILFKTRILIDDAQYDPIKKATLITDIVQSIGVIPDPVMRSVYIKECARLLQTNEQLIYAEIIRFRRKRFEQKALLQTPANYSWTEKNIKQTKGLLQSNPFEAHEKEIIRLLLNYGNYILFQEDYQSLKEKRIITVAQYIITEILKDELTFQHPIYQQIFDEYLKYHFDDNELAAEYFIRHSNVHITAVTANMLAKKDVISKKLFARNTNNLIETEENKLTELVTSVIMDFKNKKIISLIQQMMLELLEAQEKKDEDKIKQLTTHLKHLNEVKKTFAKNLGQRTIYP